MAANESTNIESILRERRKFEPSAKFSSEAKVKSLAEYEALYHRAAQDPEGFWAECAREVRMMCQHQCCQTGHMGRRHGRAVPRRKIVRGH